MRRSARHCSWSSESPIVAPSRVAYGAAARADGAGRRRAGLTTGSSSVAACFALSVAALLLLPSCGDDYPEEDPCAEVVCPEGEVCVAGVCEPDNAATSCVANEDCAEGLACRDGTCQPELDEDPACLDISCAEGERCVEGACVPDEPSPCIEDIDCPDASACIAGVCTPVTPEVRCGPIICVEGEQCIDDVCVVDIPEAFCFLEEDCLPGEICDGGVCVPKPVSELALENPAIEFSDLFVGSSYTLVAPDPSEPEDKPVDDSEDVPEDEPDITPDPEPEDGEEPVFNRRPTQLPAPSECTCQWGVTPASSVHFDSVDLCTTEMTPDMAGEFSISVAVTCGDGSGSFTVSASASILPTPCSTNDQCDDDEICVEGICAPRTGPVITVLAEQPRSPFVVAFHIRLEDQDGNPIHENVVREQFRIFEDDLEIDYGETGYSVTPAPNLPLKIIVVLDYTVSMADAGAIEDMVTAAKQFVQAEHFTATHDIGIVEFHDRTAQGEGYSVVAPLTTADAEGKAAVAEALPAAGALEPGMSRTWDAVELAVTMLGETDRQPGEVHAIVFLTDGKDTTSDASPESILATAQTNNIKLYPIGFGDVTATTLMLQEFADATRGVYLSALGGDELTDVFAEVAQDLRGQWTLRYITQKNSGTTRVRVEFDHHGQTASFEADVNVGNLEGDIHAVAVELLERRYDQQADVTEFVIKAAYLPRSINQFSFFVVQNDSTMTLQEAGGLTPPGDDWVLIGANGAYDLLGPEPLDYGSFGNIGVVTLPGDVAQLQIAHDDTIYDTLAQPKRVVFEGEYYLAPARLTITVEPPESGVVVLNPTKIAYAQGDIVSLIASATGDYAFQGWEGGATGSESIGSVIMDGDQAVTARFYPPHTLTIAIDPPGSGTVTKNPEKASYRHGEAVELTATPVGSTFSAWSGGATGTDASITVTITADTTVTATFTVGE